MKPLTKKIILILIIVLGFLIRVINIDTNPPSLYGDELTIVYDAYSLLKTGYDQTGEFLPLTFEMGAGRPAGYVYGTIPFVAIFGPGALGVRALSLISGVLVILLTFLITRRLMNQKIALIAAFLMAVNPWAVSVSRGGFEANFALFLALSGIWFFLKAEQKAWFYVLSGICFGLTIHTYPTYKVALPLFLGVFFYVFKGAGRFNNFVKQKIVLSALLVLIFFAGVSIWQTLTAASEQRFLTTNVFSQKDLARKVKQQVNNDRNLSEISKYIKPVFYNRIWGYQEALLYSYLDNFSWDYLFLKGDESPRHNMGEMGGLYMVEIIFLILGFKYLYTERKRLFYFLLFWILLAPIPTTFLLDPHNLRNLFMLPPLILVSASGLYYLMGQKFPYRRVVFAFMAVLFLVQFTVFIERIYFLSPNKFSRFWAYPAKQATMSAFENSSKYDYVLLADRIDNVEFAMPVYGLIDPQVIISQNSNWEMLGGFRVKKFGDNIYMGSFNMQNIQSVADQLDGSVLYLGEGSDKSDVLNYSIVNGKDGLSAFINAPIK